MMTANLFIHDAIQIGTFIIYPASAIHSISILNVHLAKFDFDFDWVLLDNFRRPVHYSSNSSNVFLATFPSMADSRKSVKPQYSMIKRFAGSGTGMRQSARA